MREDDILRWQRSAANLDRAVTEVQERREQDIQTALELERFLMGDAGKAAALLLSRAKGHGLSTQIIVTRVSGTDERYTLDVSDSGGDLRFYRVLGADEDSERGETTATEVIKAVRAWSQVDSGGVTLGAFSPSSFSPALPELPREIMPHLIRSLNEIAGNADTHAEALRRGVVAPPDA